MNIFDGYIPYNHPRGEIFIVKNHEEHKKYSLWVNIDDCGPVCLAETKTLTADYILDLQRCFHMGIHYAITSLKNHRVDMFNHTTGQIEELIKQEKNNK